MGSCIVCYRALADEADDCLHCGAPVSDAPNAPTAHTGPSMGVAVAALILNIVVWPGLGSLIGGRMVGWIQGFAFLLGILLAPVLIGIPIMLVAWVTGIISGVNLINESSAANRVVEGVPASERGPPQEAEEPGTPAPQR